MAVSQALIQLPTGAQVVASTGADAAPHVVNIPAGDYHGVSALLATLQAQLNAVMSGWTATLGANGRVTIANASPAALVFGDVNLRSLLGFDQDLDYPKTAAQVTAALGGYGDFTGGAGYLCNESSGNAAAVFGSPSLAPSGTPVYSLPGARGGTDKAIGFDAVTERFDGGDVWNVAAGHDLGVFWVGRFAGSPSGTGAIFSRVGAAFSNGWAVHVAATGFRFGAGPSGSLLASLGTSAWHVGQLHMGGVVIDRSTGRMRIATRALPTGLEVVSSEVAIGGSIEVAGTFRFGASPWVTTDTNFQCAALYVAHGPSVATGLSANLSAALSSFAANMKSATGAKRAFGLDGSKYARMLGALLPPGRLWRL